MFSLTVFKAVLKMYLYLDTFMYCICDISNVSILSRYIGDVSAPGLLGRYVTTDFNLSLLFQDRFNK